MEDHNNNNTERNADFNATIHELRRMRDEHEAHVKYEIDMRLSIRLMQEEIAKMDEETEHYEQKLSQIKEKIGKILPEEENKIMDLEQQLDNGVNVLHSDAEACLYNGSEMLGCLEYFNKAVDVAEKKDAIELQLKSKKLMEDTSNLCEEVMDTLSAKKSRNDEKSNMLVEECRISADLKRTLIESEKEAYNMMEECIERHESANVFLKDLRSIEEADIKSKETELNNELDTLKQEELKLIETKNDYVKMKKRVEESTLQLQKLRLEKEKAKKKCIALEKKTGNSKKVAKSKNELRSAFEKLVVENKNITENLNKVREELVSESETVKEIKKQIEEQKLLDNSEEDSKDVSKNLDKEISELEYKLYELEENCEKLEKTYEEEVKDKEKNGQDNYAEHVKSLTKPFVQVYKGITKQIKNVKNWSEESVLDFQLSAIKNLDYLNAEGTVNQIPESTMTMLKKFREKFISIINSLKGQQLEVIRLRKVINDYAERNNKMLSQIEKDDMKGKIKYLDEEYLNITKEIEEISKREMECRKQIEEVEAMEKEVEAYTRKNEKLEAEKKKLKAKLTSTAGNGSNKISANVIEEKRQKLKKLKSRNVIKRGDNQYMEEVILPRMKLKLDESRKKMEESKGISSQVLTPKVENSKDEVVIDFIDLD